MEEGPDEGDEERQDPDDDRAGDRRAAIDRAEGYRTEEGDYVIFNSKNPLAWILSSVYGYPPDAEVEAVDGEDQEGEGPTE